VQVRTEYLCAIREIRNTWIPLGDGVRLGARIWLPVDAEERPVPAILEYLPYRKNDATAARDATQQPYFAGHGYATVRIDMRGSGDSDGIMQDEYLKQEQDDAVEAIRWIAAQPWCTGAVGMIGISWGGFNSLQVAARRPPELKAIITLCSTDDRYADDIHFMGGCLLEGNMTWASTMFAYNARPPDPEHVGDDWRERWLERLDRTPPYVGEWLRHQRRDAFWKHGSVAENFADITCPVYAVGGWADGYTNAIPRLLEGLTAPKKGLIGPWAHLYPHLGSPGPAIGFLQEALRWWDHWLKGVETGIMDEPMLRVWLQGSVVPRRAYAERPGRWVAEPSWPPPNRETRQLFLLRDSLDNAPSAEERLDYRGAQQAGLDAGAWFPWGRTGDLPPDQRVEDGLSLCFTSAPLTEPLEVLGFPEVTLDVAADRPLALVAVRLGEVAPTGASSFLTRGLLNLTHRDGHENPQPLEPGKRYRVTVRLKVIGQAVPAGHRLRLAISPTYWPHAWPSPEPVTLSVFTGGASSLSLPVRPPRSEDGTLAPFGPAEGSGPYEIEVLRSPTYSWTTSQRIVTAGSTIGTARWRGDGQTEPPPDEGRTRFETVVLQDAGAARHLTSGLEYDCSSLTTYTIDEDDPLSAQIRCQWKIGIARGAWRTRLETTSLMTADARAFRVTNVLDAYEGETRLYSKTCSEVVPRDLV
jgi:putative CocE/NonD family hydrolase